MFDYIFYTIIVIFLIAYGAMPLLVYAQTKIPAFYNFIPVSEKEFLENSDEEFKSLFEEIGSNGFQYICSSSFTQQVTNTRFSVFSHPDKTISISVIRITNPNVPSLLYLEVGQLFDDGTIIDVTNTSRSSVYPKSTTKVTFQFPDIKEVKALIEVTESIISKYLSSKTPITLPKGEEMQFIEKVINDEQLELIAKGYFVKSADGDVCTVTLKGAYLMSWKLLWPIRQILEYKNRVYSKRLLEQ